MDCQRVPLKPPLKGGFLVIAYNKRIARTIERAGTCQIYNLRRVSLTYTLEQMKIVYLGPAGDYPSPTSLSILKGT
jgi:hypothetical protein